MYHDQALIPIKTLAFWDGVNVTLGLPIVRTSPDHGTALDIAGTGKADLRSMLAAIAHGRRDGRCQSHDDVVRPIRCRRCATSSRATGWRRRNRWARTSCSISI